MENIQIPGAWTLGWQSNRKETWTQSGPKTLKVQCKSCPNFLEPWWRIISMCLAMVPRSTADLLGSVQLQGSYCHLVKDNDTLSRLNGPLFGQQCPASTGKRHPEELIFDEWCSCNIVVVWLKVISVCLRCPGMPKMRGPIIILGENLAHLGPFSRQVRATVELLTLYDLYGALIQIWCNSFQSQAGSFLLLAGPTVNETKHKHMYILLCLV